MSHFTNLESDYCVPQSDAEPLTTVSHDGLELPLFDNKDVVWNKAQLKQAVVMERANIVRYMRVPRNARFVLSRLIEIAEEVFEDIASESKAEVIPHRWGFSVPPWDVHKYGYSDNLAYFSPDLPGQTALVAQVDIVPGVYTYLTDFKDVRAAVTRHTETSTSTYRWVDARVGGQFVQNPSGVYLVDIEPHVMARQDACKPGTPVITIR